MEKFLKKQSVYLVMFGYVTALRRHMPTLTVLEAIQQFMDEYKITDAELNIETGRHNYNLMQKDFYDSMKKCAKV